MTVTLNLPKNIEDRVRARAAAQGVAPEALLIRVIESSNEIADADDPMAGLSSLSDTALHRRLDLGFTSEQWSRYRQLVELRRDETITDDQMKELASLNQRLEQANVRRLAAAIELARRAGEPFESFWKGMGLGPEGGEFEE